MADIKLKEWIENYKNGEYNTNGNPFHDNAVMCEAGWYDWWCKDSHLVTAFKEFAPKIVKLSKSDKVDVENMYVFFKNNCPMVGPTYDDFRICDLESGDVQYTIQKLKRGCYGKDFSGWRVYGKENDFRLPLAEGTWREVESFFGVTKKKETAEALR